MLQRARWRRFAAFPTIAAGLAVVAMTVPADAIGAAASPQSAQPVADHGDHDSHRHDWPSAGYDLADTHFNPNEHRIKPGNVAGLAPRWTFTTGGSVSATPTVVDGSVYVPDWGGNLNAVDARTGQARWTKKISDYTGEPGDISRVSPAYWDGEIVTGDGVGGRPVTLGADVFAVDARTGAKR